MIEAVRKADKRCFNPRAPRGARPICLASGEKSVEFQSTRPARGATLEAGRIVSTPLFQSTRPARGATAAASCSWK